MAIISTFTLMSVDGFFAGPKGEIDWFKDIKADEEFNEMSSRGSQSGSAIILVLHM